jgi:hypothetical protein
MELTKKEFKRQSELNNLILNSFINKTAQYKGVDNDSSDSGSFEVKIGNSYIMISFYFDFEYKRDSYYNIVPEWKIEVTEIYDFEGDLIEVKNPDLYSLLEDKIQTILEGEDLDTWLTFGVDEERIYFEDDTPALPITL